MPASVLHNSAISRSCSACDRPGRLAPDFPCSLLASFSRHSTFPEAGNDPGIWALPGGEAYYRFLVKQSTTTDLTPEQIHQIGVEQVKQEKISYWPSPISWASQISRPLQNAATHDPKLFPTSKRAASRCLSRLSSTACAPNCLSSLGVCPKAPVVVMPVPAYSEKDQAAAYYEHGSPDGSRPGMVYVNTYQFETRSLADVEDRAYHEGLPGHHLQISIAQELTDVPDFRKLPRVHGLQRRVGSLRGTVGQGCWLLPGPYSDYGRLEGDIWRAIRLVVDTGVHSKHWTRQQMVDYFHDHSAVEESGVQAEVDRYIAWPPRRSVIR